MASQARAVVFRPPRRSEAQPGRTPERRRVQRPAFKAKGFEVGLRLLQMCLTRGTLLVVARDERPGGELGEGDHWWPKNGTDRRAGHTPERPLQTHSPTVSAP